MTFAEEMALVKALVLNPWGIATALFMAGVLFFCFIFPAILASMAPLNSNKFKEDK